MPNRLRLLTSLAAGLLCLAGAAPVGAAVDLWPVFQHDDEGTTVLYPLYVHEGDFLMQAPFYYRTNEARDHHLLWPLVKVSDGRLARAAPFYFSDHEDEFMLFPILRQTPSGTMWMLPPAYFSKTSDFSAVFPLYAHDGERTWTFPNLYFQREAGELVRVRSYFVFDWQRKDMEQRLRLLLLGGAKWGGDETRAYLMPLFYVSRAADEAKTMVGPFYRATGPDRDDRAVLPLYGDFRSADSRSFWLGSYYDQERANGWRRGLLPLYTASERTHALTGQTERSLSLFAWLYSRHQTTNAAGERIAHRRRFLALTDSLDVSGRRTIGLFGLPIWERTR